MSKEQQELLDEAYENYLKNGQQEADRNRESQTFLPMPKQMFIDKCKTNPEFSEKWGLKIEERELSEDERYELCAAQKSKMTAISEEDYIKYNIPTKLITITYNDKTIESYE
jgi:hypothetical protein